MEATRIYGLLLVAGTNPRKIAEELGVSRRLVELVCHGQRGGGPDGARVRHKVSEAVGLTEEALWGEERAA